MVPDVSHGSHAMQNPGQLRASQERAVDWYDFWLNGHEDPDPSKQEQYEQWRKLRRLHEQDTAQTGQPAPSP